MSRVVKHPLTVSSFIFYDCTHYIGQTWMIMIFLYCSQGRHWKTKGGNSVPLHQPLTRLSWCYKSARNTNCFSLETSMQRERKRREEFLSNYHLKENELIILSCWNLAGFFFSSCKYCFWLLLFSSF